MAGECEECEEGLPTIADGTLTVASPDVWVVANPDQFTFTDGLISQWTDKSGNGNHGTALSARLRPPLACHPTLMGSVPAVFVDGVTSPVAIAVSASVRVQTAFIVGVWAKDDGSNDCSLIGCSDDGARQFRINRGNGHLQMTKAGVSTLLDTSLTITKGTPFVASYRMASDLIDVRLNALTPTTNTDTTTFDANRTTRLGHKGPSGDQQPFMGLIWEFLLWNSTFTGQQHTDEQARLMAKWGIS